jgi:hypothetical protein
VLGEGGLYMKVERCRMRIAAAHEFDAALHQIGNERDIAAETVELGDDQFGLLLFAQVERCQQLRSIFVALPLSTSINPANKGALPINRMTTSFCAARPNLLSPCCVVDTRRYDT